MMSLPRCQYSLFIALFAVLATGCSNEAQEMKELNSFIHELDNMPLLPVEPLEAPLVLPTFNYAAHELPSPFSLPTTKTTTAVDQTLFPDLDRQKELLENYPLDTLEMVGTIARGEKLWGIIRANNDNTVHTVKVGSYIGKDFGRIVAIQGDKIEMVELVKSAHEEWQERPSSLSLNE